MEKLTSEINFYLNNYRHLPQETQKIIVKEYLQPFILDFIYNHTAYKQLNFYGGTCVRFLYDLNRLSEDVDFDNSAQIDISNMHLELVEYFKSVYGFTKLSSKIQQGEWGIYRIVLKFNFLKDLGLGLLDNENLHIKVEITNHKQHSIVQATPVFKHGKSFVVNHFSLETLMAGKMIACLERTYQKGNSDIFIKGRDFYDLLWFMQQKVIPYDQKLAEDGLSPYTTQSAFELLGAKIEKISKKDLQADLFPLFDNLNFVQNWIESFHGNFERFLKFYQSNKNKSFLLKDITKFDLQEKRSIDRDFIYELE